MKKAKIYGVEVDNIFSGEHSRPMWEAINKVSKRNFMVWDALYCMGCKLQEFESKMDQLLKQKKQP